MTLTPSRVHASQDGDTCTLTLSGDIDVANAADVRTAGQDLLARDTCRRLVVDLTDVTFLDSTGIGALIAVRNASVTGKQGMTLTGPIASVMKVLHLTGLDHFFNIEP